jgi:hypothetical protein
MSKSEASRSEREGRDKSPWEPMKMTFIGLIGELIQHVTVPISQVPGKKVAPPDSDVFHKQP